MIKCRRRQATDPQKLKNCQRSFTCFLLVEAEAADEIAASTSLAVILQPNFHFVFRLERLNNIKLWLVMFNLLCVKYKGRNRVGKNWVC